MLGVQYSNSNFPVDLNISPSSATTSKPSGLDDLEATFGEAAQELAILRYGIAGKVWEASYAMLNYINPPPQLQFDPKTFDWSTGSERSGYTILELGSGSGLVASTIARSLDRRCDHLVVTDLPEVIPLLKSNVAHSASGLDDQTFMTVAPLPWGDHDAAISLAERVLGDLPRRSGLTHIVCSDLVYFPELLAPLLRSLLHVTSPPFAFTAPADGDGPTICISYKVRSLSKETPFWQAFGLWFKFWPVLVRDTSREDPEWVVYGSDFEDPTYLFLARRRPGSLRWKIPPVDHDLLGGVGAQGSETRKSDETFETLLFMTMS